MAMKRDEIETRRRRAVLGILLGAACLAGGCTMRPAQAPEETVTEPQPSAVPEYTVMFFLEGEVWREETLQRGETPQLPVWEGREQRLAGWLDETGAAADPAVPAESDAQYTAVLRPVLRDSAILLEDRDGLFCPEDPLTRSDAAQALYALLETPPVGEGIAFSDLGEEDPRLEACAAMTAGGYFQTQASPEEGGLPLFLPDEPCGTEEFCALLDDFFLPGEAEAALEGLEAGADGSLTRGEAAACLCRLLGWSEGEGYFPDVPQDHPAAGAIYACAGAGSLQPEEFAERALDGFLWFDGYLYRLGEDGYFLTDETADGLYFSASGRYTSGSLELDAYVAEYLAPLAGEGLTRLEMLEEMFNQVRDGFRYLRRNLYEPGATGWEIEEALTMFETGKGNCYCYNGAFWALARGLGYNAVTYSGTISKNKDPHAWVEILLDGVPYICDPEIEMNYWSLHQYVNTFMLPYEKAEGWQYEAPGREAG